MAWDTVTAVRCYTAAMLNLLLLLVACSGADIKTDDTGGADDTGGGSDLEAPPLVINEFLAINTATNFDTYDEYDDWVELYNTGSALVLFDGLYLSDDKDNPLKWALPTGQGLDAGDWVLLWCDDDDGEGLDSGSAVDQGDYHTSFNLDGGGESILLTYAVGGDSVRVDAIDFEAQTADLSAQRVPDGSLTWTYAAPTPAAANVGE